MPDERYYNQNVNRTEAVGSWPTADLIIIFEDSYSTFASRLRAGVFSRIKSATFPRWRRACIVHSVPTGRSSSDSSSKKTKNSSDGSSATDLAKNEAGIGQLGRALTQLADTVFVTDLWTNYYAAFSPRMERVFCGPWV